LTFLERFMDDVQTRYNRDDDTEGLWGCYASHKIKNFDLINQDLLLVTGYGITTRRTGAAEATRCSRTHHSSVVQLRGRPSHPPSTRGSSLSCGSSLCSKMKHLWGIPHVWEEALCLRTARSARSSRREHGGWRWLPNNVNPLVVPLPLLYRCL
jgi:hypothetical protein